MAAIPVTINIKLKNYPNTEYEADFSDLVQGGTVTDGGVDVPAGWYEATDAAYIFERNSETSDPTDIPYAFIISTAGILDYVGIPMYRFVESSDDSVMPYVRTNQAFVKNANTIVVNDYIYQYNGTTVYPTPDGWYTNALTLEEYYKTNNTLGKIAQVESRWWDFISIGQTTSLDQDDKNNNFKATYRIYAGERNYYAKLNSVELARATNTQLIYFNFSRQDADREIEFSESSVIAKESSLDVPTVKYVTDSTFYPYTFTDLGVVTITPDFGTQTYDYDVTVEYMLTSSGLPVGTPSTWTTSPIFTNVPLKDVTLLIRDNIGSSDSYDILFTTENSLSNIVELPALSLSNDPMVVVWSSTLSANESVKYTYTMFDKDASTILRTAVYPDVENNLYGIYDMNMLYNSYTTTDIYYKALSTVELTDNVYPFTYKVQDITSLDGSTSQTHYVIKGATDYEQLDFDINDYIGEPSSGHKFLSSWVGDYLFRSDDYAGINYAYGNFTDVDLTDEFTHIAIVKYKAGDTRGTYDYTDPDQVNFIPSIVLSSNSIYYIQLGPKNFADAVAGNYVTDNEENIISTNFLTDSDTTSYEVHLVEIVDSTTINKRSESKFIRLNKDEECSKYGSTRFLWRDQLGTYQSFSFNGLDQKVRTFSRNENSKDYYSLKGTKWTYTKGDRGRSVVNIQSSETHNVTSGWLDDDMSNNIISLYASSDAYIMDDKYDILPIVITSSNIEEKTIRKNRLFNHNIGYKMAYDLNINE